MTSGRTLIELAAFLGIAALIFALGTARITSLIDRSAVSLAVEEGAVGLRATRRQAVSSGVGASWILDVARARAGVASGGDTAWGGLPGASFSVQVQAEGATGGVPVEVRFDALGIGRVASRTLTFRRGRAEQRLTISSLGRIAR